MIESLVSIIIPCFNHGEELARAVNSALGQRYLHEIIIVDDCSTDNSKAVAELLADLDPRIAVFNTSKNSGPAATRNFGAQFATGHYLSFLDADDEYTSDFLQMTVEVLESSEEMQAVKTWVEFLNTSGDFLLDSNDPRIEAMVFSMSNNILMKSEAFRKIGGFPEDPVFRQSHGGEDVAFNRAVSKYLTPLGRIENVGYRVWSQPGDHHDIFLKNTILENDGFRFVELSDSKNPGEELDMAIKNYLSNVGKRMI